MMRGEAPEGVCAALWGRSTAFTGPEWPEGVKDAESGLGEGATGAFGAAERGCRFSGGSGSSSGSSPLMKKK